MRKRRRVLAVLLTLAALHLPSPVIAKPKAKAPRIGYLVLSPLISPPSPARVAFILHNYAAQALGMKIKQTIG
ncbi:MAG: hypothetical protein IV108_08395 [Burkholderiales bacterium]|nr:hypothetical protein [Burkholderiales bacterium]